MMIERTYRATRAGRRLLAGTALLLTSLLAQATEFSVTPIRAELKAGAMSETITVTNHSDSRLRVSVKLMAWSQDAQGKDVYEDSSDLVYFPRQMELEPGAKRLVRVGVKAPAVGSERAYRLYIEEQPEPGAAPARSQVNFYFRFGVPVFVPPRGAQAAAEMGEPRLVGGVLSVPVRNAGNQHFRLNRLVVTDGAGLRQEIGGWYTLAGSSRTYQAEIPPEACRAARTLLVTAEGEGIQLERKLDVDPASCS